MKAASCLFAASLPSAGRMVSKEAAKNSSSATSGRLFAVFMTFNNPFFVDLNEGIKAVIEAHGDKLVTLDSQNNSLKQRNDLSDILQQNPACAFPQPGELGGHSRQLDRGATEERARDRRRYR